MCLMAVFTMLGMSSCGYERVDAGCEGIKVNLYGSDKGVDLRKPMREGASDEELASLICEGITDKPAGHRFETTDSLMSKIGG